jgi:Tfp pilus assembly protein PilF
MFRISRRSRQAALLAALALSVTGCQQMGAMLGSRSNDSPASVASFGEPRPSDTVDATQKADVEMALARSVEEQGQTDQAIAMYLDVVRKDNRRADAYHRLAILHDRKGECKAAEEFYRAALDRDPRNPQVYCDFGYSLYLQRRWDEAETSLRQALTIQPHLARAHNNYGLLLARTGRSDQALVEFRRAGCAEAEARANLALALMLEERMPGAHEQYQLALLADPNSGAARTGMDALQSLNRDSESSRPVGIDDNGMAGPARTAHRRPQPTADWPTRR